MSQPSRYTIFATPEGVSQPCEVSVEAIARHGTQETHEVLAVVHVEYESHGIVNVRVEKRVARELNVRVES
jgi:hypothetical protein